jgi:hypothetical protein
MDKKTQQMVGWAAIILGILVAINQALVWPANLQYLWAALVVILGIWALVAK